MSKKVRTQFMLDQQVKRALKNYADINNVSFGSVLREALSEYIVVKKLKVKKNDNSQTAFKFYTSLADDLSFKGGKNLSREVDKIVYDL